MKFFTFILLALFTISTAGKEMKTPIIPVPQIVNSVSGQFRLPQNVKIVITGVNPESNRFAASQIKQTLRSFNNIQAEITTGKPERGSIVLLQYTPGKNERDKSPYELSDEGYVLSINSDGISIKSLTSKGIFYGVMSLVQLLEKSKNGQLDNMEIMDWPDMKVRGISDDISRGQVSTLENFKKIIRFMARYKMNTYMPYIEDVLQLKSFPSIGVGRGALTASEVRQLVEYAGNYYIDVVPVFQTLGHYENILSQKEFLRYAEFPGAASLNVSYDSTYIFLETALKEVFSLFPSPYFHMGADESYDVGLGKSSHLVEKSNIAQVHLDHYKKVYDIAKKYGKKVIMYGDIILSHPEILDGLPKDIIVVDWHYRAEFDYPSTRVFRTAGHEYYVSPSVWNFQSTFPTNVNAIPNIKYITKSGLENGSTGMINSNWGDFGSEMIKELNFYGYAWGAQCSWNYKKSDEAKFSQDYFYDFFGVNDPRAVSIYESLGSSFNLVTWHDLWRHPLLPFREPNWWETRVYPVSKVSWMESSLPVASNYINDLQAKAVRNTDHFDILRMVIHLNDFYKSKITTQYLLQDKIEGRPVDMNQLNRRIDQAISDLKTLKEEYRRIWLAYYKEDNLWMVEDKFDRLASYFSEVKRDLNGQGLKSAELQSQWIYCPISDSAFARKAAFKKEFDLKDAPKSAYLQLMGDTYVNLYINGQFAEEVYVKRSLSLWGEYKRTKFIDITKYLSQGHNIITLEAENYQPKGSAGINVIAEVSTGNETIRLMSDPTWQTRKPGDESQRWISPVTKKYPFTIVSPDFATRRPGWIER